MHNEIESNQDRQDPGQKKVRWYKGKQESVDRDQPTQERLKALDV